MVAISLYRGNLHRVPDVPRRWLMPTRRISLKDFRFLLNKRAKALSRLRSSAADAATATTSNPNPNPNPNSKQQEEGVGDNGCSKQNYNQTTEAPQPQSKPAKVSDSEEAPSKHQTDGDVKDQNRADCEFPREIDESVSSPGRKSVVPDSGCGPKDGGDVSQALQAENPVVLAEPTLEINNKGDVISDKEKRKRDFEEKLQILNAKKHNLVQMLKQILNAEEEMKRRNSMQGSVIRPSVPLQVDATIDSGSMTRHVPRMGSEANFGGDEGGDAEDVSNHNSHSRHLHRMSSTSPSADSPLRRPAFSTLQHNVVPYTNRAGLGATGSPSRFAPTGHQGHSANLPPVSVSGTHYTASSPSPAASGGTSVFRDARLTSPSWN
ncbi:hypothetical protein HHK36_015241 [Tetracentron sinense]|uniref:Uncharacterized protein n=1 Tax=Tetracentron sinense TaxID=13715 RepID=A0A835DDN9_TETSI|nr:hypothetical protein HHK36_015241 [Tetracentron sinense]